MHEWLDSIIEEQDKINARTGITRDLLDAAADYTEEQEVLDGIQQYKERISK